MKFDYDKLTIVGFNGSVEGECGYAVAVARYEPTGKHLRLAFPAAEMELLKDLRRPGEEIPRIPPEAYEPEGRPSLDDESVIRGYEERGRLTLFREGLWFKADHNAMVLYVTQRMLDTAREELRPAPLEDVFRNVLKEEPRWELLSESPEIVWVTCASVDAAFLLIDHWCKGLRHECIGRLIRFIESGERDREALGEAEAAVEMALAAARSYVLREDLFLLYSIVLTYTSPLMVKNIFEMGILPEFKKTEWTQAVFDEQRHLLLKAFHERAQAKIAARAGAASAGAGGRALLGEILAHTDERSPEELMSKVAEAVAEVGRAQEGHAQFVKAKECAESFMRRFKPDLAVYKEIVEELKRNIVLIKVETEPRLKVFASDPIFYLLPRTTRLRETKEVNFYDFLEVVRDHMDDYRRANEGRCTPLARYALEEAKDVPERFQVARR
ncbi:MAG: hypothetical protein ACJ74Q_12420 [Pyrinomonadaceae bacterium]